MGTKHSLNSNELLFLKFGGHLSSQFGERTRIQNIINSPAIFGAPDDVPKKCCIVLGLLKMARSNIKHRLSQQPRALCTPPFPSHSQSNPNQILAKGQNKVKTSLNPHPTPLQELQWSHPTNQEYKFPDISRTSDTHQMPVLCLKG